MTIFKWLCSKRAMALAAAGAVALGVGMVATPNEAAAQCAIVNTSDDPDTTVGTFGELRDATTNPDGDNVAVDCTDSITSGDIQTDAVTTNEIADGTITSDDLGTDSVTANELANNAVDTDAIQDGAVTTDKIADDAVTWGKLSPGVRDRVNENQEGVAIALALQNPDLVGNETFGMSVNWGGFESSNALGIAATGVLGHDLFGGGDRLAIAGGVGFGLDKDTVGGRVGAQVTW
ncbi:hypothetical protein [Dichotomicrobium thermohalophilum]|uniref:YadA-like protein n=1 Tax=Dichotomicrobium thermohalophilum TaxID=933063 RepID=A0A397PD41_9HYPH|nr:hypothetical protein [Dichotomicrobium thermohalophilum]RIA47416.1 hypothetical protein BXY53_2495 [Dichotomicrobium thermohalophilum]